MKFIGIDIGVLGAIGVIDETGKFLGVKDVPTAVMKVGRTNRSVYLPQDMLRLLEKAKGDGDAHVFMELVHAMPKDMGGSVAAFSMGKGSAYWEMACVALGIPYTLVPPPTWKKKMLTGVPKGSGKAPSLVRAHQLFPGAKKYLTRKADDGRAECLLLAEYGRQTYQEGNAPVEEPKKDDGVGAC